MRRKSSSRRMLRGLEPAGLSSTVERLLDAVTEPAQAADRDTRRFELVAQTADVHLEGVRAHVGLEGKYRIEQRLLADGLPGVLHEHFQNRELAHRELDRIRADERAFSRRIEAQISDLAPRHVVVAPPQQGA